MPSWNIHTAHVQHLLAHNNPAELGIRDANSFLFGNFVPDIYVGYMVKEPSGILPYTATHLANPVAIPIPREQEFWDTYIEPRLEVPQDMPTGPAPITVDEGVAISRAGGVFAIPPTPEQRAHLLEILAAPDYRPNDVLLGAWAHLACDAAYNTATHAWLKEYNVPAGEQTRIRKQGDFDLYGRTLPITLECTVTPELIAQAAVFPQYCVKEVDVVASVEAADAIVRDNQQHHIEGTPDYSLFTAEYFSKLYRSVNEYLESRLRAYAQRING